MLVIVPFIMLIFLFNPLSIEFNLICHLLALLGAHHIFHVSRIRVKSSVRNVSNCSIFYVKIYSLTYIWWAQFCSFLLLLFYFLAFAMTVDTVAGAKPREPQTLARFSPGSIFLATNNLVSRVKFFHILFIPFCKRRQSVFLMDVMGEKSQST